MYNVNILNKCDDENVRAAIIAAVEEIMAGNEDLMVGKMKRNNLEIPIWARTSRQEIMNNLF